MIALDTNVLVRVLVDDPENAQQNDRARALVSKHDKFYISSIVAAEMVWVLTGRGAFDFSKAEVITALEELKENVAFVLESPETYESALQQYKKSNADFSDALILATAMARNVDKLVTFDKKFAKLKNVFLV